jgi:hypothetical protein
MVVRGGARGRSEAGRIRRPWPWLLVLAFWVGSAGAASDLNADFTAANRLYEAGKFAEATAAYQAIIDRGYESATLYFNQGNALLKAGELGEAIVAFERARTLAPRDEDIKENLERARSLAVDVVPVPAGSIFLSRLAAIKDWLSPAEALRAAAVCMWLVLLTASCSRLWPRGRAGLRIATWVLVGLLVATSALAAIKVADAARTRTAVVVVREVPVRSGPGENYTARFTLHEGTTVRILRLAGDFTEIELTAETGGWVPKAAVLQVRR